MTLRKLSVTLFSILTIMALFPQKSLAQAQTTGDGTIQVQLVNKTSGGKGVNDVSLELKTFADGAEKGNAKSNADARGKATFTGLNTDPAYIYQVNLNYQEADYTSEISFKKEEKSRNLEVVVWDATDDDKFIKIGAAHIVVQFEGDALKITEYYRVDNLGDKTYIGSKNVVSLGKKETLRFYLPKGAQMHEFAMGLMDWRVALENEALVDTMGVEPGSKEIAFTYISKFSPSNHTIPIVANRAIDDLTLVIEEKGFKVSSQQLSPPQLAKMGNISFIVMNKKDVKKGETIQATLSGLPGANPVNNLRWIGIGLLVVALAFGVTYPLIRRKTATVKVNDTEDRDQLLQDVAQLDDAFESGQMSKEEYLRLRSEKMARLMDLSQQK